MRYGKIRIEDGNLIFTKHMRLNNLPCKDIVWAFKKREGAESSYSRQLVLNYLVIKTKRNKRYEFDMSEQEIQECLGFLKALNPEIATGFPRGARILLQNSDNTRDLGAINTIDGRHILPERLLRSGDLYHLSQNDQIKLKEKFNLKTVIDFRSMEERKRRPDTIIQGVEYYHIPIFDEITNDSSTHFYTAKQFMEYKGNPFDYYENQYDKLILDQYSINQYARFLDILLRNEKGAVLWHGSEGKDRTGIATALLLCVLGVSKEQILEDYMKSNGCLEKEYNYMLRYIQSRKEDTAQVAENITAYYKVKKDYLERVFEAIERHYGSIARFIRRALYLTPKAIEELQKKYLI